MKSILFTSLFALSVVGCVEKSDDAPDALIDLTPRIAETTTTKEIGVGLSIVDEGLLLQIIGLPKDAVIECNMNHRPLAVCHDKAVLVVPEEEEIFVTVTALKDGKIVGFGESNHLTQILAETGAFDQDSEENPLRLSLDDSNLKIGMNVPLSESFTFSFKLENDNGCTPTLMCLYDQTTSDFWTECDKGGESYTIPKELLALGKQEISVQATCDNLATPSDPLTFHWYGIPDGYEPLNLIASQIAKSTFEVDLIRDPDCPFENQVFECSNDDIRFATCPTGNIISKAQDESMFVRMSCDGTKGPSLKMEHP